MIRNAYCVLAVVLLLIVGFTALPQEGMAKAGKAEVSAAAPQAVLAQKININTADEALLSQLPGIGPKTAAAITAYRQENGQFKNVEDLVQIKGIGSTKLAKIKPYLENI